MATDIGNIPPSASGGGGAATLPSTLVLADATTNTAPDILVERHTTSGTAAAGFGETNAVELQNASGTVRRVMTDATKYSVATNAAEFSTREVAVMQAGALTAVGGYSFEFGGNVPCLNVGAVASRSGVILSGAVVQILASASQVCSFATSAITSLKNHTFSARLIQGQGATVASATTITLGSDGNEFPISGTTTINGITTTTWTAGAVIYLRFAGILTLTHNSGAPGGGAVAIKTTTAANVTTAANSVATLLYDGTFWVQTCPITPGY